MQTLVVYLALLLLTLSLGGFVVVAALLGIEPKPNGFMEGFPRIFARGVLRAAGARVHVRNPEHIAHGKSRIYVSNHVSWFDVFALASVIPRYRFVAKKELRKVPIFGPAAGKVAAIYIDRRNRSAAFDAYDAAAKQVREGVSVAVYPEGTRGRSYELRSFKKGPFVLAIAAQVPVVPVIVYGTRDIQPKGAVRVRSGDIELTFLDPIPTAGLTYEDRDALMRTVWTRMAEELERHHGVRSDPAALEAGAGAA
ncbi:MAG TPA: lysophospholipid acyltransferase family protein [Gemmatimonadaceae bacterium]|nr:lysophospholipid acyltransferase family protein [Gemmatimonadaceae bacterium]